MHCTNKAFPQKPATLAGQMSPPAKHMVFDEQWNYITLGSSLTFEQRIPSWKLAATWVTCWTLRTKTDSRNYTDVSQTLWLGSRPPEYQVQQYPGFSMNSGFCLISILMSLR